MKKVFKILCLGAIPLMIAGICLVHPCEAQTASSGGATLSHTLGIGFRVGMNFARVAGGSDSMHYQYKPGLMVSVFFSPPHKGIIGYRTELLYSRQGFQYADGKGNTGTVSNDYLMMPHLMTINITKFVQLQAGAFAGYLLHSTDSNAPSESGSSGSGDQNIMNYLNRLDYGAAAGLEVHPFKGLIVNARYNMGFAKLYKKQEEAPQADLQNYFNPMGGIDLKNAVMQFSVGYQF